MTRNVEPVYFFIAAIENNVRGGEDDSYLPPPPSIAWGYFTFYARVVSQSASIYTVNVLLCPSREREK